MRKHWFLVAGVAILACGLVAILRWPARPPVPERYTPLDLPGPLTPLEAESASEPYPGLQVKVKSLDHKGNRTAMVVVLQWTGGGSFMFIRPWSLLWVRFLDTAGNLAGPEVTERFFLSKEFQGGSYDVMLARAGRLGPGWFESEQGKRASRFEFTVLLDPPGGAEYVECRLGVLATKPVPLPK